MSKAVANEHGVTWSDSRNVFRVFMKKLTVVLLGLTAALAVAVFAGQGHASAATAIAAHSHPTWIEQNATDLVNLRSVGEEDTFGWTLCNPLLASGEGNPQMAACAAGQVPDFTTETAFATWAATAPKYARVVFDIEGWAASDGEAATYASELHYVVLAAQEAKTRGLELVEMPVAPFSEQAGLDASAAKWGAWGADAQIQSAVGNKEYPALFSDAYDAVRKVSKTARVFAGMGSDAGGTPRTPAEMEAAWNSVKAEAYGVFNNSPTWGPPGTGCALVNGCAETDRTFLDYVDK
jgi:hypothetical protein